MQLTYVKKERDAVARKMIEEELKNGGKGDLSASYQQHIKDIQHGIKAERSVISTIRRQKAKAVLFTTKPKSSMMKPVEPVTDSNTVDAEGFKAVDYEGEEDGESDENNYAMTALVTEFLHKLFPGSSILTKKRNAPEIICNNHEYFSMLAGAGMTQTRVLRFLNLTTKVLSLIFVNTVFFGIYFPPDSTCTVMTTKVRDRFVRGLQFSTAPCLKKNSFLHILFKLLFTHLF